MPLAGRADVGVLSQRIDLEQPEHVGLGCSSMSPARMSCNRSCWAGFTTPVLWVWSSQIRRSSGKGLDTACHEMAPVRRPCSRLAVFHGAPWTYLLVRPLRSYHNAPRSLLHILTAPLTCDSAHRLIFPLNIGNN